MRSTRTIRSFTFGLAIAAAVFAARPAAAQYLIDTGPGVTTTIGQNLLISSGSTTCSPQPQCASAFQFLAGQIVLTEAATITSVEAWMSSVSPGAVMRVRIRADVNGLPSTAAPIFFTPSSLFSRDYTFTTSAAPFANAGFNWAVFSGYNAVLAAGTYWVSIEPISATNVAMPGGAPNPLPKTAFFGNGNPGYLALNQANASSRLGFRVAGTKFPGIAFGTGARVIASGNSFGCFLCGFSYDRIAAGVSLVSPYEGDALTNAYIFHTPGAMAHGNGKLINNSQKAGAYAVTDSAIAAGRGISFRTYRNMSDLPKTFRVNAVLDGRIDGGIARAAIHIFDSAGFTDTLGSSPTLKPAEVLLQSDGIGAIGNAGTNISLARFFPPEAVLDSELVTANFLGGVASSVQVRTDLVTVEAGAAITVLYDVAVYSNLNGSVDFSNTLTAAANQFTDASDAVVQEIVAVGPAAPRAPAATAVALSPASQTTPLATLQSITATVTASGGAPVADAPVIMTVTSGPNAGLVMPGSTDASGTVTMSYTSASLGVDMISATSGALTSNAVQNTWVAGAVDRITISPDNASIVAGGSQSYTAEGFDAFDNSLGDVTGSTTFSISPGGSCTAATCTASNAGDYTVTGSIGSVSDTADLEVTGGGGGGGNFVFQGFFEPLDMSTTTIVWNSAKAGASIPVKWRLTLNGQAVSDPASFAGLFAYPVSCESGGGSVEDAIEVEAPGGSGLQYSGDGNWQFNWKSPKNGKGTCHVLMVRFSDGSASPGANVKLK